MDYYDNPLSMFFGAILSLVGGIVGLIVSIVIIVVIVKAIANFLKKKGGVGNLKGGNKWE